MEKKIVQTAPTRVQLSRAKGWRMPPNTAKVDRSTRWGNFYRVGEPMSDKLIKRWGHRLGDFSNRQYVCTDASDAVRKFAGVLAFDEAIWPALREQLRGKNLACWCEIGTSCHADVLLELANVGSISDQDGTAKDASGRAT